MATILETVATQTAAPVPTTVVTRAVSRIEKATDFREGYCTRFHKVISKPNIFDISNSLNSR